MYKPTKEELKALFDECNQMYFWGKLGKCSFFYFPKTTLGCLGKYQDRQDSKGRPNDQIWFGQIVHWTEKELRRVMIHEMVHMYNTRIEKHWWYGLMGHGPCFRKHRRRIRRDFGIDIMDGSEAVYVKEEYKPKTWEKVLQWLIDR